MEFMKACTHARNIVIQCDQTGCDAEYYYTGEGCTCPMCDEPAKKIYLLVSGNMVTSGGKILIPPEHEQDMKSLGTYSDIVDRMAITKGMKYINRKFFDEEIPFDSDDALAAVGRTQDGRLALLNLSNHKIILNDSTMFNERTVPPYKEGSAKPFIIDKDNAVPVGAYYMFFGKNIDITTENGSIDVAQIERYYGTTSISKFIQIKVIQED